MEKGTHACNKPANSCYTQRMLIWRKLRSNAQDATGYLEAKSRTASILFPALVNQARLALAMMWSSKILFAEIQSANLLSQSIGPILQIFSIGSDLSWSNLMQTLVHAGKARDDNCSCVVRIYKSYSRFQTLILVLANREDIKNMARGRIEDRSGRVRIQAFPAGRGLLCESCWPNLEMVHVSR